MKKSVKILSLLLALFMLVGASSTATFAQKSYPDIVIAYKDIAMGQVDRKSYSICEKVTDSEKGEVYKVAANPDSENGAAIILDGWTYSGAKIDATKYNTIILIYKYNTEKPVQGKAKFNILKWQEFSMESKLHNNFRSFLRCIRQRCKRHGTIWL